MLDHPAPFDPAAEVAAARAALLAIVRTRPAEWWTAHELATRPDTAGRRRSVVRSALNGLIRDRVFEVDKRWRFRLLE